MKLLRLLVVVPLLALAACSGGDDEPAAAEPSTTTTAPAVTADSTPATSTNDTTDTTEATSPATTPTTATPTTAPAAAVGLASADVSVPPYVPQAAVLTLTLDNPAQVEVAATADDHQVAVPLTAQAATTHEIPIVGMRADRTYDLAVTAVVDGTSVELELPDDVVVQTPPLPEWMPAHTVTSDPSRVSPGITIIESSPNRTAAPDDTDDTAEASGDDEDPVYPTAVAIGYDAEGEIVWYYTNQGLGGIEQTDHGTFISHYGPFGAREFDMVGNVIGHWQPAFVGGNGTVDPGSLPDGNEGDAPPVSVDPDWVELRSFHHEMRTMPNGNLIGLSTALHELTPEQREQICPDDPVEFKAVSDVIVEFTREGEAIRTWDLFDVIDIVEIPGTEMCATDGGLFSSLENRDWTHANAVVYDPDRDAILVSSRHTDHVLAIDHLDDEGPQSQLRWIIGVGATIPLDGDPPFHQHAVELLDDGAIIIYDNGNARPGTAVDDPVNPTYSRAVIYEVDDASDDPSTWSAHQRWEHIALDDEGMPVFTSFIGDADILANGNVLITHGGIGPFPPNPDFPLRALLIEVVPEGESGGDIVWQLDSDPAQSHTVYRSEKIETFYAGEAWITQP